MEFLLEHKADVNVNDKKGITPLHAAATGYKDIVELLLERKADIDAKDNKGNTPLKLAEDNNHKDIADLLRKYGAKE